MYKNHVFNFVSIYIASPSKMNCIFPFLLVGPTYNAHGSLYRLLL